jgi:diguanylate cyclase (GGDEF)-like protein
MLRQLAREDGLTGLANRRWLDAQWAHECERARRYKHAIAVAMIDIDHFKSINDRFSHRVGDEVLRRVARLLRDAFRRGDIVGRYGGEEFMVAWVETPLAHAVAVCQKLRQRVAALALDDLHPDLKNATISIGLAGCDADADDAALVAQADAQLYRAKAEGRDRVCW